MNMEKKHGANNFWNSTSHILIYFNVFLHIRLS